jgi:hypothetical protein
MYLLHSCLVDKLYTYIVFFSSLFLLVLGSFLDSFWVLSLTRSRFFPSLVLGQLEEACDGGCL